MHLLWQIRLLSLNKVAPRHYLPCHTNIGDGGDEGGGREKVCVSLCVCVCVCVCGVVWCGVVWCGVCVCVWGGGGVT